jgi:Xaa-Pro aminopeptidase
MHKKMKRALLILLLIPCTAILTAQQNLPTDYLSKEFHKSRRDAFRSLMPPNSVAFIFSYPERTFSNDVNYVFHQNPDLYYLSGYREPDAVLILFKDWQGQGDSAFNELFFVRLRDSSQEIWTGRRLGVEGTKKTLGFTRVYEGKAFAQFPFDFKKFDKVIYDDIPNDLRRDATGYDLFGLLKSFKEKVRLDQGDPELHRTISTIARAISVQSLPRLAAYCTQMAEKNESFRNDPIIQQVLSKPDSAAIESIKAKARQQGVWGTDLYRDITSQLRQIKTPEELVLMRKSVRISGLAHAEVMKSITPSMSEREVEGIHLYVHQKYGAEDEGYPPIVGAGANGCILHYEENSDTRIDNQLLLMDVGSEYHGYSADVTRTIPASGKFTPEQKAIYQLVYDAQEEIFKLCKEGTPFGDLNKKAIDVLAAGLIRLGIIQDRKQVAKYYPHSCSHYLGLDVHDKGQRGVSLMENMVITVEPGIYIPAGSPCDPKWWNIGVRIEDDVVIQKNGFELLSAAAPRSWQDIEKMEAQASMFKAMTLPKL